MRVPWEWPDSTVVRVIDGDSLVAEVTKDIGFHGSVTYQVKLRLNRINCAKVTTALGKSAKELVEETTKDVPVHISTVGPYKYGDEWMAEIILPDGKNLSDVLVTADFAAYWSGVGPRPLESEV